MLCKPLEFGWVQGFKVQGFRVLERGVSGELGGHNFDGSLFVRVDHHILVSKFGVGTDCGTS